MLTRLEEKLLQFITQYITQNGHGPTLKEIGEALNINSKGTVHRYVESLVKKKHLRRTGRGWRGIRLTGERDRRLTILPLEGRIAAGKPIEAIPDQEEVNFSDLLLGPDRFVLKVAGDSMIDAGILDGDTVLIQRTDTADNGEIVVALVEGHEATLKRLRRRGASIALEPANTAHETRIFGPDQVKVQGRLVGLVRKY